MRDYELIRSKRRSLALQVTPDLRVVVRAPTRLSKREIERFVREHEAWIDEHIKKMRLQKQAHPEPTQEDIAALRALAQKVLPERVAHFSRVMALTPTNVRITAARTRFGSCSPKNALCFSLYLMRYPLEAIDYVVVHELAHIVYKNHGKDFYALIESILPDYLRRKALLRG
jgi:predicted metal-dependent hydrolase